MTQRKTAQERRSVQRWAVEEYGAAATEYAMILAVAVIAVMVSVMMLGSKVRGGLESTKGSVATAANLGGGSGESGGGESGNSNSGGSGPTGNSAGTLPQVGVIAAVEAVKPSPWPADRVEAAAVSLRSITVDVECVSQKEKE